MKKLNNQTGSAHVVIIIILIAAVLGLLGFVFWQNFIKKTSPQTTSQVTKTTATTPVSNSTTTPKAPASAVYSGSGIAFNYPGTGWQTVTPGNYPDTTDVAVIQTSDYSAPNPRDSTVQQVGARIVISSGNISTFGAIAKDHQRSVDNGIGTTSAITTVNGYQTYEVVQTKNNQYDTVIYDGNTRYDINYITSANDLMASTVGYKLVTSSFKAN